jgi:hypothetical protein
MPQPLPLHHLGRLDLIKRVGILERLLRQAVETSYREEPSWRQEAIDYFYDPQGWPKS